MPIYEFECSQCDHRFEQLVPSYGSKASCPKCNSAKTKRMISTFAAHGGSAGTPCESGACPAGAAASAATCPGGQCPFS